MFDPTAFDNMKVVIEGALYDMDISGEIIITDRNDLINIAKMSRQFEVSFRLPNSSVTAGMEMVSNIVNLAAELIPGSLLENQSGCNVRLTFFHEGKFTSDDYKAMEIILLDVWGETRKITQAIHYNPLDNPMKIKNVITIDFDRLISEDQMDDLVEMTDFMVATLQHLQYFVSESK
jgi:hypothetical protein